MPSEVLSPAVFGTETTLRARLRAHYSEIFEAATAADPAKGDALEGYLAAALRQGMPLSATLFAEIAQEDAEIILDLAEAITPKTSEEWRIDLVEQEKKQAPRSAHRRFLRNQRHPFPFFLCHRPLPR